jgi:DnaJ-class molecular chaperone
VHGRRKCYCKECHGTGLCEHLRMKSKCKDCGGGSICIHQKLKSRCKMCKLPASSQQASPDTLKNA